MNTSAERALPPCNFCGGAKKLKNCNQCLQFGAYHFEKEVNFYTVDTDTEPEDGLQLTNDVTV